MIRPFFVFALPRSRTFWLSRYLSYGGWTCGHEDIRHVRHPDDIKAWLSLPATGTAETAAAPFWRTLQALAPEARVVLVRRPVADVCASLHRLDAFDPPALAATLRRFDAKLDQIAARWPGALSVTFDDLADETVCARVFEHCLPFRHDPRWYATMAPLNLQVNLPALIRQMLAFQPQLSRVAATLKQQTLLALRSRAVEPPVGFRFQTEPFEAFYADAQALFRDHLVSVGESPDNAESKNLPLFRLMDQAGALQILTARCNGRMFGYLMTVLSPSFEYRDGAMAVHTLFYASPDAPGLGMKLQRAALPLLRRRGVKEVFFRAGPRGAGPKMGALYRRLGAADDGAMFRLTM